MTAGMQKEKIVSPPSTPWQFPRGQRGVDVRERLRSVCIWQMSPQGWRWLGHFFPVQTGNGV